MAGQQQHVDMYRKLLLRKQLLRAAAPGAVYVPFIGDGDIAAECYSESMVYGADIDAERVAIASARLATCDVRVADCNGWPFDGIDEVFSVADFDAYAYPYDSFRAFWESAQKADRLVVFFTDGERQAVKRAPAFRTPDGEKHAALGSGTNARRPFYNFWLQRYCLPWLSEAIAPYRVVKKASYLRRDMLYWGVVLGR